MAMHAQAACTRSMGIRRSTSHPSALTKKNGGAAVESRRRRKGGSPRGLADSGDGGDAEEGAARPAVLLDRGTRACRDGAAYDESHVDPPRAFLVTESNAGGTVTQGRRN
jgi:hypothetical protein